ncbi:hypothetical protein Tco_0174631 [Tanacetum coccineum]
MSISHITISSDSEAERWVIRFIHDPIIAQEAEVLSLHPEYLRDWTLNPIHPEAWPRGVGEEKASSEEILQMMTLFDMLYAALTTTDSDSTFNTLAPTS